MPITIAKFRKKYYDVYIVKKVFIAGGTGFLGRAAMEKFIRCGVIVAAASRTGGRVGNTDVAALDFFAESGETLREYFAKESFDVFVYALGPDDRVMPPAPAYGYFREKLVDRCYDILSAAVAAGAKRIVLLGSYFAHFDKIYKGALSANHPYIRARREQEDAALSLNAEVVVLELPYIFGVPENGKPLWRESFLAHYDAYPAVFMTGGGTAATDVNGVADAVFAAAHCGRGCIPVGGANASYIELLKKMLLYAKDGRKVYKIPAFIGALGAKKILKEYRKAGREPGLNPVKLMTQIQNREFYLDPEETERALNYGEFGFTAVRDIDEQLQKTMRACYPERFGKEK